MDFIKLNKALQTNKKDMKIKFKHVSAHSGDAYNDEADKLAKEGARKYQPDDWIKQNHFYRWKSIQPNNATKLQSK